MAIEISTEELLNLCSSIEDTIGRKMQTPKDFKHLSEEIFNRVHSLISPSTLMRLWGYIESDVKPRVSTLNQLARFVGFRDLQDFLQMDHKNRQSSVVICRHLNVSTDIQRGQKLRLRWLPDRVCDIIYRGNLYFEVIRSEHTGLKKGATFMCPLIIEGEPLYLDNVVQYDIPGSGYVCGKRNGVTFNFLTDADAE
ncbi:MAG: hypothetical protein HDS64_03155 [Bacteroidales bacterium]|nr:hypothetical protein [Bacteroidales bacterium]MBD5281855.1 hypothetical protein [Bacteroides sp.]MDE6262411.1 hypothetical protein [Muribaculaceae bacterium]MBD5352082.1 hypothetical protein [Bacteroides sp.]MBD5359849.1 hypothetical protein [Bacteroides sp.]